MDAPVHTSALFRRVEASFLRQGLMQHLGAGLLRVESGLCEVALPYSDRVTQQQGGFHVTHISAEGWQSNCALMQQTLVPVPRAH
jgi:hypothetical protein